MEPDPQTAESWEGSVPFSLVYPHWGNEVILSRNGLHVDPDLDYGHAQQLDPYSSCLPPSNLPSKNALVLPADDTTRNNTALGVTQQPSFVASEKTGLASYSFPPDMSGYYQMGQSSEAYLPSSVLIGGPMPFVAIGNENKNGSPALTAGTNLYGSPSNPNSMDCLSTQSAVLSQLPPIDDTQLLEPWQSTRNENTPNDSAAPLSTSASETPENGAHFTLEVRDVDGDLRDLYGHCMDHHFSLSYKQIEEFVSSQRKRYQENPVHNERPTSEWSQKVKKPRQAHQSSKRKKLRHPSHDNLIAKGYSGFQKLRRPKKTGGNGMYKCTVGCSCTFDVKKNWRKHERLHYPQEIWLCRHHDCRHEDHSTRVSLQREHAKRHYLARHHEGANEETLNKNKIDVPHSEYPKKCIFGNCDIVFRDFNERMDHIANHLEQHHALDRSRISTHNEADELQQECLYIQSSSEDDDNVSEAESDSDVLCTDTDSKPDGSQDSDPGTGAGGCSSGSASGSQIRFHAGSSGSAGTSNPDNLGTDSGWQDTSQQRHVSLRRFPFPSPRVQSSKTFADFEISQEGPCAFMAMTLRNWNFHTSVEKGHGGTWTLLLLVIESSLQRIALTASLTTVTGFEGGTESSWQIIQPHELTIMENTVLLRPQISPTKISAALVRMREYFQDIANRNRVLF